MPNYLPKSSGPGATKPQRISAFRVPSPHSIVWWLLGRKEKLAEKQSLCVARLQEISRKLAGRGFFSLAYDRRVAALEGGRGG